MKIAMYDLGGFLLEVFDVKNSRELANILNIPEPSLYNCLDGSTHSTNFLQFRKVNKGRSAVVRIPDAYKVLKGKAGKRVIKYYKGKLITTYENLKEAEEYTGVFSSNIQEACKGKLKTSGGFEWKYLE